MYVLSAGDLPETHKRCAGQIIPAKIVNDWPQLGREDGYSNLTGFPDHANMGLPATVWLTSRIYNPTGTAGTWHFAGDLQKAEEGATQ